MTPEYSLLSEFYVRKITEQYPNLKVIFVMRDPLEGAISGIRMRLKQKGFTESSPQTEIDGFFIWCASDWDVIKRGNYQQMISIWARAANDSNLLVMFVMVKKYKRFKGSTSKAKKWLRGLTEREPNWLFHWQLGLLPAIEQ
jgi:hypothetical protein